MTDLTIRTSRPADRDTAARLTLAAYQQYAEPYADLWTDYRRNILAAVNDQAASEQILAERDGRLVGTVLLCPARPDDTRDPDGVPRPWPEARLLAVDPAERRTGIGTALMAECARRARAAGSPYLSLHSTRHMAVAVEIYRRLGFERAPELDFQPGPGLTVEGYRLDLATANEGDW